MGVVTSGPAAGQRGAAHNMRMCMCMCTDSGVITSGPAAARRGAGRCRREASGRSATAHRPPGNRASAARSW
eukprot:scaffold52433_cov63-Phaeocystis_antarctica.AAC.2